MKIGFVQNNPEFGDKEANFREIDKLLQNVRADLIVLPELFATGYAFTSKDEVIKLGEPVECGETTDFLVEMAQKADAIVVGGFIEKDNDKIYNAAMMVSNTGVVDIYRKIHLFYKEKQWFQPGNRPFKVHYFEDKDVTVGMMICFDWIFPEVARTLAKLGADIIAHPANLVLPYCQKAMTTHCLSNRVFAITANRIGREHRGEDDFLFTGTSQITDHEGEVLASAPQDAISVMFADIVVEKARNKYITKYNNIFTDRRPEYYQLD